MDLKSKKLRQIEELRQKIADAMKPTEWFEQLLVNGRENPTLNRSKSNETAQSPRSGQCSTSSDALADATRGRRSIFFSGPHPDESQIVSSALSLNSATPPCIVAAHRQCLLGEHRIRHLETHLLELSDDLERIAEALESEKVAQAHKTAKYRELQGKLNLITRAYQALQEEACELAAAVEAEKAKRDLLQQTMAEKDFDEGDDSGVLRRLLRQKSELEDAIRLKENQMDALKSLEPLTLQDPMRMVASGTPSDSTLRLMWEAAAPVRRILLLREGLMILKAHSINLCEDLDAIAAIIEKLQSEPQYALYSPYSPEGCLWRQQKLHEAFSAMVQTIGEKQYESDPTAAQQLIDKIMYFVVVYDLFENNFDAVVGAVMLSSSMWDEAHGALSALQLSKRVTEDARQRAAAMKARRTSKANPAPPSRRSSMAV
jgi:hypothetical protein